MVFTNGTGVAGSKYVALFEHLASWGFVVIGNEEPETWNGISSDKSIGYLLEQNEKSDSRFYQKSMLTILELRDIRKVVQVCLTQ